VIGITLDSNIYISALIFGGKPLRILEMGLDGRADIAISEEILEETLGIMRHKFKLPEERVAQARQYIEAATRRVTPTESVNVVSDSQDNRILECAQAAGSEFIITLSLFMTTPT
jgi:putative PIN family toxin of toxin-antitoxin system